MMFLVAKHATIPHGNKVYHNDNGNDLLYILVRGILLCCYIFIF
jgi:hypothetical protein